MSLDLWLSRPICPTCSRGEGTDFFNYTYNVSHMWYAIFPEAEEMVDIDGLTGYESLEKLRFALAVLTEMPDKFIAMNPENGWGDYEGFKRYISRLITQAEFLPEWTWKAAR